MTDPRGLAATLLAIVSAGGRSAPERICAQCVDTLPVTGASITLMAPSGEQELVHATDELAGQLDALQFSLGEGPSIEAFRERRPVLVADIAPGRVDLHGPVSQPSEPPAIDDYSFDAQRWPIFLASAQGTAARSLHVFPLQVGAIGIGVICLYHGSPGLLAGDELAGALRAADATLWSLLGLRSGDTLGDGAGPGAVDPYDWLTSAPLRRREAYQATGMIIAQLNVTAEVALARLRGYAFAHGRPLDEVAREVVEGRLRFDLEET